MRSPFLCYFPFLTWCIDVVVAFSVCEGRRFWPVFTGLLKPVRGSPGGFVFDLDACSSVVVVVGPQGARGTPLVVHRMARDDVFV